MKRILLTTIFLLTFAVGFSQQNVFNRDNSNTGDFGSGNLPWYYETSNNNQGDPDNGASTRNNVKIGHNNFVIMSTNGRFYIVRTLEFQTAATTNRTINNSSGGLSASFGIYNNSTGSHTFNTPIGIDGSPVQIQANNGPFTFTTNIFMNANNVEFGGSNTTTVSGVLQGSGKLVKNGTGILRLSNTNTYTGNTELDNGELWIETTGNAIANNNIFLGNGGLLGNTTKIFLSKSDGGTTFSRNITINAGNAGTRVIGSLNTTNTNTFSGNIVRSSNQPLTIEVVNTGGTVAITGDINGSGTVTKTGLGTATFSGTNKTYSGATTVSAGTLRVVRDGHTADISSTAIAFTFASTTQAAGTYNFLAGQLIGTGRTLSSNLVSTKSVSFDYSTSTVTICDNVGTPSTPTPSASTICQASSPTAYTTLATNATSYTWSVTGAGNSISGTGTTGTVTWAAGFTGSATVSVVANGCNGSSPSVDTTVTVTPTVGTPSTPSPSATTICQASSPTAYTTLATNATSYTWSVTGAGNSISGTGTTGTVTWAAGFTGSATVSVIANGCNGSSASVDTTVTVTPTVGTPSTPSPSATTICQASSPTAYTTSATNATSYTWSVTGAGNSISGTGTTGTVTWAAGFTGPATVSVVANGCNGPSASAATTVTVNPNVTYYQDLDGDGFGNPSVSQVTCTGAPLGYVANNLDCYPTQLTYQDIDGDGYGNPAVLVACGTFNNTDCNDNQLQYTDADGDGFGSGVLTDCGVGNNLDCYPTQ
ncbi:beta strand repeat-containing protein, partial [Flavobacterium paronense]